MILFVIIIAVHLIISLEKPDKAFWWAVIFFTDPGGYLQTYFTREMIGGLQITDLTFILLLIPIFSPKIKLREAFENKDIVWLLKYQLFFTLIYHIIIFGFVAGGSITALLNLLQYERLTLWGWFSLIPAYIFFKRDYTYIIKLSMVISFFIMCLFYLTYLGIDLIPLWTADRYIGSGLIRKALLSYGVTDWFLWFSLIIFVYKIRIRKKRMIYSIAVMFFFALLLTLTRRNYVYLIGGSVLTIIILNHIRGIKFSFAPYIKFATILIVLLIPLTFLNSIILKTVQEGLLDIHMIVTKGETSSGLEDYRISHDIPIHLAKFEQSPMIGFGYNEDWYSNQSELGGLSANDTPLTAALGMFGLVGCGLFFIYYLKIILIIKNNFYLLKKAYLKKLFLSDPYPFLFAVIMICSILYTYTIGFMNYFVDIIVGERRVIGMLQIGFMLASFSIIKNKLRIENNVKSK